MLVAARFEIATRGCEHRFEAIHHSRTGIGSGFISHSLDTAAEITVNCAVRNQVPAALVSSIESGNLSTSLVDENVAGRNIPRVKPRPKEPIERSPCDHRQFARRGSHVSGPAGPAVECSEDIERVPGREIVR